jgi:hypothetical protein
MKIADLLSETPQPVSNPEFAARHWDRSQAEMPDLPEAMLALLSTRRKPWTQLDGFTKHAYATHLRDLMRSQQTQPNLPGLDEYQTIASATGKHGMINRRKAKAAVDPHNYFKHEKSAYQNVK